MGPIQESKGTPILRDDMLRTSRRKIVTDLTLYKIHEVLILLQINFEIKLMLHNMISKLIVSKLSKIETRRPKILEGINLRSINVGNLTLENNERTPLLEDTMNYFSHC